MEELTPITIFGAEAFDIPYPLCISTAYSDDMIFLRILLTLDSNIHCIKTTATLSQLIASLKKGMDGYEHLIFMPKKCYMQCHAF